jgi:hypothetical protein
MIGLKSCAVESTESRSLNIIIFMDIIVSKLSFLKSMATTNIYISQALQVAIKVQLFFLN